MRRGALRVEAYKKFSRDGNAAAIQSEQLEGASCETRRRAVKVAELYRQFLEDGNRVCKWAIITLVVVGSALGLLSQLDRGRIRRYARALRRSGKLLAVATRRRSLR